MSNKRIMYKMSGAKDNKAQVKATKVQNSADALAALPFASGSIFLLCFSLIFAFLKVNIKRPS